MALYLKTVRGNLLHLPLCECGPSGCSLKEWLRKKEGLSIGEIVLSHNGLLVQESDPLISDGVYIANLRLCGGKGGFGSLLRMLGAQIEKTTNHEACRDLSGRRMRDVNNEKKLADWIAGKADREREREEKRQAKLERLRSEPRHRFVDPSYHKQKSEVTESLEEAISQGMYASVDVPSTSSSDKRKHDDDDKELQAGSKKSHLWVGIDGASDSDDSDSDVEDTDIQLPRSPEDQEPDETTGVERKESNQEPASSSSISSPTGTEAASSNQELPSLSEEVTEETVEDDSTENSEETAKQNGENHDRADIDVNNADGDLKVVLSFSLDEMQSAAEVEAFGLDTLKTELMSSGLKCGGTLQERAQRLFSVKGLSADQIDPSLKAKPSKGKKKQKKK